MLKRLTLTAILLALMAFPVTGFAANTAAGADDAAAAAETESYQLKVGGMT